MSIVLVLEPKCKKIFVPWLQAFFIQNSINSAYIVYYLIRLCLSSCSLCKCYVLEFNLFEPMEIAFPYV